MYVSVNILKKNCDTEAIEAISSQLRKELPGLRGFSATSMRNMRTFYEEWRLLEGNSSVTTDEFTEINTNSAVTITNFADDADKDYAGYIMQDFRQPMGVATYKTADEIDPELLKALPPKEELQRVFEESCEEKESEDERKKA